MKRFFLTGILALCYILSYAQKTKIVNETHTYYAPEHLSPIEAKAEAVKHAKIKILADHFGTTIHSSSSIVIGNEDKSSTLGECEVNGEWIRTIGEPVIKFLGYQDNTTAWEVTLHGEIRELPKSTIDLCVKLLADERNLGSETDTFRPKQRFSVYFKTPVKGYVAIYLADPLGGSVFRLLPYKNNDLGSVPVSPRDEYKFFGDDSGQRMVFESDRDVEIDKLYVIFSTENFVRANDTVDYSVDTAAPVLAWDDFQHWISRCRHHDKEMCIKTFEVIIKKK